MKVKNTAKTKQNMMVISSNRSQISSNRRGIENNLSLIKEVKNTCGLNIMSDSEFRQKLSKLQALVATRDARIMANPKKYLNDMSKRCHELLSVLGDVERALSPDLIFDIAQESNIRPESINGEAYLRCNAALHVLSKYRNGEYRSK